MKAVRVEKPGTARVVELDTPVPGEGEVLIRVEASGICGTDVHIYCGEYLGDYPIVPGHEGAGSVAAVGDGVSRFAVGDQVAFEPNVACDNCRSCLSNRQNFCENWQGIGVTRPGCMAELVLAPEKNVFAAAGMDAATACFMEPLSCVLHGIQKAGIRPGDQVLIMGAGPIGLLLLQAALDLGAVGLTVVERVPARAGLAGRLGATSIEEDLRALPADSFDVVIDATGAIPVMEHATDFVRYGGTVLLFGVAPKGQTMDVEPFQIFRKGLRIVSSYTSLRNSYQALDMIRSGRISVDGLVSHELPLDQFERGIRLIRSGKEDVRKVLIVPTP